MSISIDNYTSQLGDLYSSTSSSASSTSSLDGTLDKDYSTATNDELLEVCKDFESYFTEQIFKALKSMVPESSEDSSSTMADTLSYFDDMLVQEYANNSANGDGIGIAKMLYEQMKRNYSI